MKHTSTDKAFVVISAAAVFSAMFAGFWMLGFPSQQRLISLDEKRVQNLSIIADDLRKATVTATGESAKPLPKQLPESISSAPYFTDPSTGAPYEYNRLSDTTYELCATFDTRSDRQFNDAQRLGVSSWRHPSGRHCFQLSKGRIDP